MQSVSCIRPRAEERLTEMLSKSAIVDDNLLDIAPSVPRFADTVDIAPSTAFKAAVAVLTELTAIF